MIDFYFYNLTILHNGQKGRKERTKEVQASQGLKSYIFSRNFRIQQEDSLHCFLSFNFVSGVYGEMYIQSDHQLQH